MADAIGIPEDMLRKAACYGCVQDQCGFRPASGHDGRYPQALWRRIPAHFDPRQYLGEGRDFITQVVKHKIETVLGSANRV